MTQGLPYETRREIRELKLAGYSMNQIARKLKLTKGQVAGILWRSGMMRKKDGQVQVPNPGGYADKRS
jgi:IS30 family transposase